MTTTYDEPLLQPAATEPAPALPVPRRPLLDLFLISFLILFFELTCIRWFGSTVVFLTFFTNIVLLACFLGMSVGLLAAARKQNFIRWVIPLAFIAVGLAMGLFWLYHNYSDRLTINVGGQNTDPKFIYFGTEYRPADPSHFVIPLWFIAGVFFSLIAVTFVGLGQTMGRAFDAIPNRIRAYTTDVLGSLCGIVAFGIMSYLQLSPQFWFIVVLLLLLYFLRARWNAIQIVGAMAIMFLIAMSSYGVGHRGQIFWSPYYKVAYTPQTGGIDTNNISHQQMVKMSDTGGRYMMPHLLNRDAGNAPFQDVLIIGAGSGNDVAAALANAARHIDAVEIDPMINQIGRWDHPDHPYDDKRVTVHLDDGRSFVRKTDKQYDLAVYALVDSLVLHSGYSSLRLENFLFTERALRDVKARLKPGGVFAMYNYFRFGWVAGRLNELIKEVYGVEPLVISMPHQDVIDPTTNQANYITFLLVGTDSEKLQNIRRQFEDKGNSFWLNWHPSQNLMMNGFAKDPPYAGDAWGKIAPAKVNSAGIRFLPTDDWPQLYLHEKTIPWAPNGQGMLVVAIMSLVILFAFAPVRTIRPNGQMFFLGAGFMLLETKGVVHMALLFGSTWVVNSVVFFAILVMILCANLFVQIIKPRNLWPYYILLGLALAANTLIPMDWFLSLPGIWKTIASCAVVFVPIFFAGIIFATVFRDSLHPDVDFGSNVAGIILGGLSEQLSLVLGFNHLILVAILFYALSAVLKPRLRLAAV
jgi:spermidine synthase